MELLGPPPITNRLLIPLTDFGTVSGGVTALGGNGWEVARSGIGDVEYTSTLAEGPVLETTSQVTYNNTVAAYRLRYLGKVPTGGTFRLGDSRDIPYNCTAAQMQIALGIDMAAWTVYGGPLDVDYLMLYSSVSNIKIPNPVVDPSNLIPAGQLTAHDMYDKRRALSTNRDPSLVVASSDAVVAVYSGGTDRLDITSWYEWPGIGIHRTPVLPVMDVAFELSYPSGVSPQLTSAATFKVFGTVKLVFSNIVTSSYGIAATAQSWSTSDLPWDATGKEVSDAVVSAINAITTKFPDDILTLQADGHTIPLLGKNLVAVSAGAYSAGKVSDGTISIRYTLTGATPVTLVLTTNVGATYNLVCKTACVTTDGYDYGPGVSAPVLAAVNSSKLGGDYIYKYDHGLNLISTHKTGINCVRLAKSPTGYKAICVTEASSQTLDPVGNTYGYYIDYGDGNGTHPHFVGQIVVWPTDHTVLPSTVNPFNAPGWTTDVNTTGAPQAVPPNAPGFSSFMSGDNTSWTFYGVDIRTVIPKLLTDGGYAFGEVIPGPGGGLAVRFIYKLTLKYYHRLVPTGIAYGPGRVVPHYVYRDYDNNFNLRAEINMYDTISYNIGGGGILRPGLESANYYEKITSRPCLGYPALAPLLKFNDGTFGIFTYYKISRTDTWCLVRYNDANVVQSAVPTSLYYTLRPDVILVSTRVSHVDAADNIITLENRASTSVCKIYDRNLSAVRSITITGQVIVAASDKDLNKYILVFDPTNYQYRISAEGYILLKYDVNWVEQGRVKVGTSYFPDNIMKVDLGAQSGPGGLLNYAFRYWYLNAFCTDDCFVVYGLSMAWWERTYPGYAQ